MVEESKDYFIQSPQTYGVNTIVMPILWVKKLWLRSIKETGFSFRPDPGAMDISAAPTPIPVD